MNECIMRAQFLYYFKYLNCMKNHKTSKLLTKKLPHLDINFY